MARYPKEWLYKVSKYNVFIINYKTKLFVIYFEIFFLAIFFAFNKILSKEFLK